MATLPKTHLQSASASRRFAFIIACLVGTQPAFAQSPAPTDGQTTPTVGLLIQDPLSATMQIQDPLSSTEQGQTPLPETFELEGRAWRLKARQDAFADTVFKLQLRTFYLDRHKFDDSQSESMAIGGWAGVKTGYFLDHISFGATGYTSQKLIGDEDKDGALLLKPGQESYSVIGELYADIKVVQDLNLYIGRKEFDTPYINRNDVRMTPNTFEAIALQGRHKFGEGKEDGAIKYGVGYFDKIKERNSDEFVSMAKDAGATVERGVYVAGANYQQGTFSFGAINYYSDDIINIGYTEAKFGSSFSETFKPTLSLQFTDQRSVGDDLLQGKHFSSQAYGMKVDVPVGRALFTAAYTYTAEGAAMQNPWSGYPGYTSVQVEDFNRAGESGTLVRASYEFLSLEGLSAYALWVHGTEPEVEGQYAKDEYDLNLQWAAPEGMLKGLAFRVRYAIVEQHGGNVDDLTDLRLIINYARQF